MAHRYRCYPDLDQVAVLQRHCSDARYVWNLALEQPGINVAQKRGLNRAILAQSWSLLRRRLTDKAATCGVLVVAVDPAHTSERCAACGHTVAENRESQAVFGCRACGHQANADVNAARNILAAGLAVTARGGTSPKGPDEARTRPGPLAA